jgi:DNA-binding MarR family transcriptional regulator
MIADSFSFIANYLWRESINNLEKQLTLEEFRNFSSNDYYYLTSIYYLRNPNFSQVAEALNLTKPAISALIRKLSNMKLIEKIQSQEDKRVYNIVLTEKGEQIVKGDEKSYRKIDELIKSSLKDEEEYKRVEKLLIEIVNNIKD